MTTDNTGQTLHRLKKKFLHWLGNDTSVINLKGIKQKTLHAKVTLTRPLQIFQSDFL